MFAINSPAVVGQINQEMKGSTRPRVNLNHLRDLQIPLAPLGEQQRIVARLETLLGKVEACERRLAKIPRLLKRFRQSVLAAACSGRLTDDWRGRNPEVENAAQLVAKVRVQRAVRFQDASVRKDLDLPELPETWT
jgi:type I restriction enzyme, S subunit